MLSTWEYMKRPDHFISNDDSVAVSKPEVGRPKPTRFRVDQVHEEFLSDATKCHELITMIDELNINS